MGDLIIRYYDPISNTEITPYVHDISGATTIDDMPEESKRFFHQKAKYGYIWTCLNGKWPEEVPIERPPVTNLATQKLQSINSQADALLEPITSQYPRSEVLSWDKQEIEARRWQEWIDSDQSEPEPPTHYIDNILVTRTDVDKPELVRRIITKADAYTTTGQITGIRHNLEKQVEDILADNTLTDDEKRAAIEAIDEEKAYSVVKLD